jgi:hypothetical protein
MPNAMSMMLVSMPAAVGAVDKMILKVVPQISALLEGMYDAMPMVAIQQG